MQRILLAALSIAIIAGMFFVSGAAVLAATNPYTTACKEGGKSSAACHTNGADQLTGSKGVIRKITGLVAIIAGFAAVIMMIVGGISYITSNGDGAKTASAKNTIIYAAIGLVVIGLAQAIISFIVSRV
ncbi:MAG TPA: hypothetical protein VGG13_03255 [Candidatus Saccharimonadales bacterium]|jgi:hypothetical protein